MVELISYAGRAGVSILADYVRTMTPGAPTAPVEAVADDGCPMCRAHDDIAVARSLVQTMAERATPDGRVPDHMAATVVLVERHLASAERRLVAVAEARPALAEDAETLRGKVVRARAGLPDRQTLTRVSAQAAEQVISDCWRSCAALADAYFAPAGDTTGGRLPALVADLTPAERQALTRLLAEEDSRGPGR